MTLELLENPVTGETMKVLESTNQVFRIEYALKPQGEIPLTHCHPGVSQEIEVLSGEMHLTVDGEHVVVGAGEKVTAPPGAMHFQWNPGNVAAVAVETYRPGGRNHDFFRTLFGIARDGYTDVHGMPSLLMRAAIFSEFHDTIRPSDRMARAIIALLGPLTLLSGHRARVRAYAKAARP